MWNRRWFLIAFILCGTMAYAYTPLNIEDLIQPKEAAYRVGISDVPENQYIEALSQKPNEITQNIERITAREQNNVDVSYADLNIKNLSREIAQDLLFDEREMVADLSLLWQGAAMQSDTINFALYKLANPDADKPNKSAIKNMLKTIASMSTLAGTAMANPLLAGTSFITGDVLGIMGQDTKALNYKYTKVTDADMIILIRKVEDLQQTTVNLYYDYMSAKKQLEMANKLVIERQKKFQLAQKNNATREMVVITDAYYRTALDRQRAARADFFSKRATLEQFVGNETFTQFENELAQRENGENTNQKKEVENEYNNTIKNVEQYTNSLDENINPASEDENTNIENKDNTLSNEQNEDLLAANADKYSTKGLIFVHNNDKYKREPWETESQNQKSQDITSQNSKASKKSKKQSKQITEVEENIDPLPLTKEIKQPKQQTYNGVELLPLDDIRAPELQFNRNGYSIFDK